MSSDRAHAMRPDESGKFRGIGGLVFYIWGENSQDDIVYLLEVCIHSCFLKNFPILSISVLKVCIIRMYFSASPPTGMSSESFSNLKQD